MRKTSGSIPDVYEQEDSGQFNWVFDIEMDAQTKGLVKRSNRLMALIKEKTPPKCYRDLRARKLPSSYSERKILEFDDNAVFELEQYIESLRTNTADRCILGYYEDRAGALNISPSDGLSGQGSVNRYNL
jgi:hypothetical protein